MYQADIKTVDGFCASLLREHIHLLEPVDGRCLTPDFRVLDEAEAQLLRERALERTMETFYQDIENGDEEAAQLAGTLGAGRDDRALTALVLELHGKIQSHPYPEKWLRAAAESWRQLPSSLADSDYGRTVMEDTVRRALFWAGQLERAVAAMEDCEPVYKANAAQFLAAAAELRRYEQASQEGWDAMGRCAAGAAAGRYGEKRRERQRPRRGQGRAGETQEGQGGDDRALPRDGAGASGGSGRQQRRPCWRCCV